MSVTLMELLSSFTQLGVYSHFRTPGERLQRFFKMELGGSAEKKERGRQFMYRYFDNNRDVANFRSPGSAPATVTNQFIGQVSGTFGRLHEKKIIEYETLGNLRPLELNAPLDPGGQQYITKQQKHLYQRFANAREVAVSGMIRGGLQFVISGQDWIPVYTGGNVTVNYNIPAGNLTQLQDSGGNTILTTGWQNANANIPGNLATIEQTSEFLTGDPISHVWTDSSVWNNVLSNTLVQTQAGSAATAYLVWDEKEDKNADGKPVRYFEARLKCYPHLLWHIYNAGLNINGQFTRFFDGTSAMFCPEPDNDWVEMGVGSEYVVEFPGQDPQEQVGFFAWGKTSDEPASIALLAVDNFCPFLYIPKCIQFAIVRF
jgi:hypothetical protein